MPPTVTGRQPDGNGAVILGAGFAGLVAAHELRRHGVDAQVFEAAPQVGGLARSFRDDEGFSFDFGAHFITNRLADELGVGSQCRIVRRYDESVRLDGKSIRYPFGLLTTPGFLGSALHARVFERSTPSNAAEWFRRQYGRRLADRVAIPLLEAWSGAQATALAASVGDKLPGTAESLWLKAGSRLRRRAIGCGYCSSQPEGWNVWHVYPRDGVGSVVGKLATSLGDRVRLESPVERIHVEGGSVRGVTGGGRFHSSRMVFSTAPVHILARLVDGVDFSRLERFRYRPMIFVNLMLEGRGLLPTTMLWTPEKQYSFHRLAEATRSMPWLAPEGKTIITADIGCEPDDELWRLDDDALVDMCLRQIEPIVPGIRKQFIKARALRARFAYPVFLEEYEKERQDFIRSTGVAGLFSIGRNGRFSHDLMEDVFWSTRRAVAEAVDLSG